MARWTCLSILVIEPAPSHDFVKMSVGDAVVNMSRLAEFKRLDDTVDSLALRGAKMIDGNFEVGG
jgi:hypothetical protein